jgi:hypothetical protein
MPRNAELFSVCFFCENWKSENPEKRENIFQYNIFAPPNMKGVCTANPEGAEVLTQGRHAPLGNVQDETSAQSPCDVSYMVFDKKSSTTIRLSAFKLHPSLKTKHK